MRRCLVLLALLTGCSLFAQDIGNVPDSVISALDSFLSAEQRIELLKQGYLFRSVYNKGNAVPRLTPLFAVPQTFAENRNKGNPSFLIEALYLHKKTQGSIKDTAKISRILRSISKLEGLQYYSSSRKKMYHILLTILKRKAGLPTLLTILLRIFRSMWCKRI